MRIVSLEPSITATLAELGALKQVVGVTRYCPRLVDVGDRPKLEPTWSVKPESVAALEPDLVIASTPFREGNVDSLLQAGFDVLALYPRTLADIYRHIRLLGRLTDTYQRAVTIVSEMQAELDALRREDGPRTYVEIWFDPFRTGETWAKEIVGALGGQFVGEPNTEISLDALVKADPEVIVLAWAGVAKIDPATVAQRPGWADITAVREGRVHAIDEIRLNAPAPTLRFAFREIADAMAD